MTGSPDGLLPAAFSLRGRTALVTGARRGIGAAIAVGYAAAGADLVLLARDAALDDTLEAIKQNGGGAATVVTADFADPAAVEQVATALVRDHRIDILVNNAGTIRRAPAAETATADWQHVIDVNLNSTWAVTRPVGAEMVRRGAGKIVTIASLLSFQGGITVPAYTASKHAVAGLTRALANEWGPAGVQVNAIAPGYISTDNTTDLRADTDREAAIRDRIPAGRWGRPDDLVGAAVFLASAAADYVNGHVLAVDGGWLAR
ncbi:short-chain dehydrogenase/reductase SDR [Kribbella flavida DSM 17836]|uniref:Short-chain dehydrogenase/reductase SDR n=1 Tax=Kribbella flavida (strain DSM 17836 / JCM 10339 / NBRC 14399) TaxID=479435 RepID=D2PV01_KRIFD|nr:SDR family oxidoreductase [Kribbella flavida]ADB31467.1 short-chain dehydrogenase/reductase SDR [Kribbella flavida DSM 17836]